MKNYIKHISDYEWLCTKCGFAFEIYGPGRSYFGPNFCPNCGVQSKNGESKKQKNNAKRYCSNCIYYESGICEQDEAEYKEVPRDWSCDNYMRRLAPGR